MGTSDEFSQYHITGPRVEPVPWRKRNQMQALEPDKIKKERKKERKIVIIPGHKAALGLMSYCCWFLYLGQWRPGLSQFLGF